MGPTGMSILPLLGKFTEFAARVCRFLCQRSFLRSFYLPQLVRLIEHAETGLVFRSRYPVYRKPARNMRAPNTDVQGSSAGVKRGTPPEGLGVARCPCRRVAEFIHR